MKNAKPLSQSGLTNATAENYSLLEAFDVAGGAVAGTLHRKADKPLQDAFSWRRGRRSLVAIVCDGCGSAPYSEVGARLGARLLCEAVGGRLDAGLEVADPVVWRRVRADVLAQLGRLATAMGGDFAGTVTDHFLFTVVGVAITEDAAAVFGAGDGVYAINGAVEVLEAGDGNRPDYVAYGLLGDDDAELLVHRVIPTAELESVLIGTDGVTDVLVAEDQRVPGRDERVGALSRFWTDDFVFGNRDGVRRRLAMLAREHQSLDWDERRVDRTPGLLRDDTTVVALRRRAAARGAS
jgi:hypothetical protein